MCRFCGRPMHPLRLTPYIVYWIHRGPDIEECARVNPASPGYPMVMVHQNFLRHFIEGWGQIKKVMDDIHEAKQNADTHA
jgi:hypothetical protein